MQAENLFEGADYLFRVFAENKVGPSQKPAELQIPIRAKMPYGNYCQTQSVILCGKGSCFFYESKLNPKERKLRKKTRDKKLAYRRNTLFCDMPIATYLEIVLHDVQIPVGNYFAVDF